MSSYTKEQDYFSSFAEVNGQYTNIRWFWKDPFLESSITLEMSVRGRNHTKHQEIIAAQGDALGSWRQENQEVILGYPENLTLAWPIRLSQHNLTSLIK